MHHPPLQQTMESRIHPKMTQLPPGGYLSRSNQIIEVEIIKPIPLNVGPSTSYKSSAFCDVCHLFHFYSNFFTHFMQNSDYILCLFLTIYLFFYFFYPRPSLNHCIIRWFRWSRTL